MNWILKMVWRNSRTRLPRLLTFSLSIVLGVGAFVAIDSFNYNIQQDLEEEASSLLGADLSFYRNQPISDTLQARIDSIPGEHSSERQFNSMVQFPNGGTRLVYVRAMEGDYPYYGEIETIPESASRSFRSKRSVVVAQTLMIQYDLKIGDSIKIGKASFVIEGEVVKAPGQTSVGFTAAPPVYMPLRYLEETGLVQRGSRIYYVDYIKTLSSVDVNGLVENLKKPADKEFVRIVTIDKRKDRFGSAFGNFNKFLNLVGFISILLGSLGIASSVYAFAKESRSSISVLRCLGASGHQATAIFFVQIIAIGIIGSIGGILLSLGIQSYLPSLLGGFLPIDIEFEISVLSLLKGAVLGILVTLLFSIYPLLKISGVSPLSVLRAVDFDEIEVKKTFLYVMGGLILAFVYFFSVMILKEFSSAAIFTLALVLILAALYGLGVVILKVAKTLASNASNYEWKQGLSNMYRPNNQTMTLVFTLGLGTALIGALLFVQDFLLSELKISGEGEKPNMILFDVRKDQQEELTVFIKDKDVKVKERVPIVTMRVKSIKGRSREEIKDDSTIRIPGHVVNREYRVTYRDHLKKSESIVKGQWIDEAKYGEPVYVSIESRLAEQAGLDIGDKMEFSISGVPQEVVVGSIRDVDWTSFTTNFTVLFPKGVLEEAPQFISYSISTKSKEQSALFQQSLVKAYPNVSVIDLDLVVDTVTEILDQVVLAIRFMTILSVITGLIVLSSSVLTTRYQRMKENVLLRTLGASTKQLVKITGVEFFALGNVAVFSGLILAILLAFASSYYFVQVTYSLNFVISGIIYGAIVVAVFILGLTLNRKIIRKPPMEVLRSEV